MSAQIRARALGLRTVIAVAIAGIVAGALLGPGRATASAPSDPSSPQRARSVLVITLPATSWLDLRRTAPPSLTRLLRHSALADLATRTIRNRTLPGPGYLALGAGARSLAGADAAATNLAPSERLDGIPADAVYRVRTGRNFTHGVAALGWPQLVATNAKASYGAEPGSLGHALAHAGVGRYVIANADQRDATGTVYHREAALVVADQHGRVPGRVDGILERDPNAPYGVRLDNGAVDAAFPPDFATRRQVVVVDASDLARTDAYRPLASPHQRAVLVARAMRRTDDLVGRLLRHVDLHRDAVVVVAPYHSSRARTLTVAAIHAPGVAPGLVESATTRRAGFLQIVDLAPTVLDLLRIERPDAIEGRPAEYHTADDSYRDRVDWLVDTDHAAQFRDATIGTTTALLVTITITMVVLSMLWYRFGRRTDPASIQATTLRVASLGFIGYVLATFVVGALPADEWGRSAYFVLVVGIALAFAGLCLLFGRRNPLDPLLIALGAVVLLHVVDLLSGAHLELNTVFGYTPTVGIRLAGIGNPGSAEVSAAALLFAVLVTARAPRRGRPIGIGVLLVVLLVVGAPIWGQDYGGALALAPTIVLWWLLVRGRAIRLRSVLAAFAVLVGVGVLAGLVDLTRPANARTHVGRLFEKVGTDGPGAFFTVVGRKASLMIGTFSNTAWVLAVVSVLVLVAVGGLRTSLPRRLVAAVPTLRPGGLCFGVLVALATLLNDSGVAVAGMMLATLLPVLVYLVTRLEEARRAAIEPADLLGSRVPVAARAPG